MKVINHIRGLCDDTGQEVPYGVPFDGPYEIIRLADSRKTKNGVTMVTFADDETEITDLESDDPEGDDPEGDDPEGDDPEGDDPEGDDPESDDPEGDDPEGIIFTCPVEDCDYETDQQAAFNGHIKYKHPDFEEVVAENGDE